MSVQPAITFPPELLLAAQGIRVAFFDVDGVMTDGGILFSDEGETLKRFHILDGLGLKLLQRAGITPVVIPSRGSAATGSGLGSHRSLTSSRVATARTSLPAACASSQAVSSRMSPAARASRRTGPARPGVQGDAGYLWRLRETDADQLSREANVPKGVAEKVLQGLRH